MSGSSVLADAEQSLRNADTATALQQLQAQIRTQPGDARLRTFLFQLLAVRGDWQRALMRGGLFGLVAYGTYDLTGLAVMRDWPLRITLIDIAWGTFVSAAGAVAGTLAWRALSAA